MLDCILMCAGFDAVLSAWLLHAAGAWTSAGFMLIENLPIDAKLARLKSVCEELKATDHLVLIKDLRKGWEKHREPRNLIAHAPNMGQELGTGRIVFMAARAHRGEPGNLSMHLVTPATVGAARDYFRQAGAQILQVSGIPIEPPGDIS